MVLGFSARDDALHSFHADRVREILYQICAEENQSCFRIQNGNVNEKRRYLGICASILRANLVCFRLDYASFLRNRYAVCVGQNGKRGWALRRPCLFDTVDSAARRSGSDRICIKKEF